MSSGEPVALSAPLKGVNLVEASAGTGKTWTLSGLYLRLVVEAGLPVEGILAVTYTRAATAELRSRIRARLAELLAALDGRAVDDEFCIRLAQRSSDEALARERARAALAGFDQAAIYTIHGFCQRALAECAFACGLPFESEILADERELLRAATEDFWRRELAAPGATAGHRDAFVAYLLEREPSPAGLADWLAVFLRRRARRVDAPAPADLAAAWLPCRDARAAAAAAWSRHRTEVADLLDGHPDLNRTRYRRDAIPGWIAELDAHFAPGARAQALPAKFEKFTPDGLAAGTKAKGRPPEHPFFALAAAYRAAQAPWQAALEAEAAQFMLRLADFARAELARVKRERRLQSYDDLLDGLHAALAGPAGDGLAAALRQRYPAALIDEFQDTDSLQYGIFRRLYGEAGGHALFLVGDPKQAIYSFRGADVFAYLEAAAQAGLRLRLGYNQRSVPALVRAVNTLFGAAGRPFRLADIGYAPVEAADRPRAALVENGVADAAPLRVHLLPDAEGGKPLSKEQARRLAAAAAARSLARLLAAGGPRLADAPLQGRDIAVLVSTHSQGELMRQALAELGIASAGQSRRSVFRSAQATELERVMLALVEPQREPLVRAALVSSLFGLDAAALLALESDEAAWDRWLGVFQAYHELWRAQGFARMFRRLLAEQQVVARLAGYTDGERQLTNFFHLAELLHREGDAGRGLDALTQWLGARRHEATASEATQLRLDSDENLVRILTIHAAKGLEFPVCLCPFLWEGRGAEDGEVFYHDPEAANAAVLDLGSPRAGAARERAHEEDLSERLRLAYVALTRATHRCHLWWGRVSAAEHSALAWLLHEGADSLPDAARLRLRAGQLAAAGAGSIALEADEAAPAAPPLAPAGCAPLDAARLGRPLPAAWRVASFSSLMHGADSVWRTDLPDHDASRDELPPAAPEPPGGGRFAFPRGAQAGTCLHAMLEHLDFSAAPASWTPAIARELAAAGYPGAWAAQTGDWLADALASPLPGGAPDLALVRLSRRATLREMEFQLPAAGARLERLGRLLADHGLAAPTLAAQTLSGFLKGYIDLVFEHDGRYHLADYKSNWLGGTLADYAPERLEAAMAQEGYVVQAVLYAFALHRLLRVRLRGYDYARHFGGAHYLFLRGMGRAGAGRGVHCLHPPRRLIEALDALFDGQEAS